MTASPTLKAWWTRPFHGVSHGQVNGKKSYATVVEHGSFVELKRWFPGCGFSPTETHHATVDEAKAVAEKWLNTPGLQ